VKLWIGPLATLALLTPNVTEAESLAAINVRGTDGTASMLNDGDPELPIVIGEIHGLAPGDPTSPGDNLIWGGANITPDVRVVDYYFQGDAVAGPTHGEGSPPASPDSVYLLMEVLEGGNPEEIPVLWHVQAYTHYDGTGAEDPTQFDLDQQGTEFEVLGVTLTISGTVVPGDKIVIHNSGITDWGLSGVADIDGDGLPSYIASVDAEHFESVCGPDEDSHHDFDYSTVTLFGWEITDAGEFVMGQFDVTLDETTSGNTWPGGDAFDVVRVCEGDINGDGDVDLHDLATLLAWYGAQEGDSDYDAAADFDDNGAIDLADLAILLSNYGCNV